MANKMVCRFCGAKFDEMLPKCPFCSCTNYKGAEAEYFEKLEDVREDMEDLEEVPEEETKKAFREQGKFLKKVFLIIVVLALLGIAWKIFMDRLFERDEKADFFWKQENFPIMADLDEQERAILAEYESNILKDFEERWDMSEEDYQAFYYQLEENRGWVTYKSCEEYVENRYNER